MTIVAATLFLSLATTFGGDARSELAGVVGDETGQPVADAAVFIHSAQSRSGSGSQSPAGYLDCRKKRSTDVAGRFAFQGLDPNLMFRVLVLAKGYQPTFVNDVDPAAGEVRVKLPAANPLPADAKRVLKGRVVDEEGAPIVGAEIEPFGCSLPGRRYWGPTPNIDDVAISDTNGEFIITMREDVNGIDLRVRAPRLATRNFTLVPPGPKVNDLPMQEGAHLKGRVLKDGQPMPHLKMGIVQSRRGAENFVGERVTMTDANGEFLFSNLPAAEPMNVYGKMAAAAPHGAVPVKAVATGNEKATIDAGRLTVVPAYRVAGRVILSDGASIPDGTQLILGRADAWDSAIVRLPPDGTFEFRGVPDELVVIHLRIKGYDFSDKNISLERVNNRLKGIVTKDLTNLVIAMQAGKKWTSVHKMPEEVQQRWWAEFEALKRRPLEGVPADIQKLERGS